MHVLAFDWLLPAAAACPLASHLKKTFIAWSQVQLRRVMYDVMCWRCGDTALHIAARHAHIRLFKVSEWGCAGTSNVTVWVPALIVIGDIN